MQDRSFDRVFSPSKRDHQRHQGRGITRYGALLGLLFQISDDILDVTQSTDVLGKTAAKDLSSNKATYPSVYGLEESRELLQKVYRDTLSALDELDAPTTLLEQLAHYVAHRRS